MRLPAITRWSAKLRPSDATGLLLRILLVLSACINLLYVSHLGLTEVDRARGDSPYYHLAGKGVEQLIERPFHYAGKLVRNDLTAEERASLGLEKSYNGGLLRSPAYGIFLGWLYTIFGDDIRVVAVVQALLLTLVVYLLYKLGAELFGRRTGVLAAAIALLYAAFWYYAGRVLTEAPALLLLVACVLFAVRAARDSARRWPALAGLASGALLLCKISMRYFPILLLVLVLLFARKQGRPKLWRKSKAFLIGLAIILVPWLLFSLMAFRAPLLSAPLNTGPLYTVYRGNYAPNDGWEDDGAGDRLTREFMEASAHAAPGDFEKGKVYQAAARKAIRYHTRDFLLLLARKVHRMWNRPADPWAHSLGFFTLPAQVGWHRILVVMALLGAIWLALLRPRAVFLLAPIAYLTLLHGATRVETRFAMPAMPFVILMASAAVAMLLSNRWWQSRATLRRIGARCLREPALIAALLFMAAAFAGTTAGWLQWFPSLSPKAARTLSLLFPLGAFLASGIALAHLFRERVSAAGQALSPARARFAAFAPIGILCVVLGAQAIGNPFWTEWHAHLTSPSQTIVQEILLPGPLELDHFQGAALQIDMLGSLSRDCRVTVRVNGQTVKEFPRGLEVDEKKFLYPEELNPGLSTRLRDGLQAVLKRVRESDAREPVGYEYFRQWHRIPFDLALLEGVDRIRVEIAVTQGGSGGFVEVYGDYPRTGGPAGSDRDARERDAMGSGEMQRFVGPSFARTLYETSLDQLSGNAGDRRRADCRLIHEEPMLSQATRSERIDSGKARADDLSTDYGRQEGVYRIRVDLQAKGSFYLEAPRGGEPSITWHFDSDGPQPWPRATAKDMRWAQRSEATFSGYLVL